MAVVPPLGRWSIMYVRMNDIRDAKIVWYRTLTVMPYADPRFVEWLQQYEFEVDPSAIIDVIMNDQARTIELCEEWATESRFQLKQLESPAVLPDFMRGKA